MHISERTRQASEAAASAHRAAEQAASELEIEARRRARYALAKWLAWVEKHHPAQIRKVSKDEAARNSAAALIEEALIEFIDLPDPDEAAADAREVYVETEDSLMERDDD